MTCLKLINGINCVVCELSMLDFYSLEALEARIDSFHIVSAHAPNSLVPRYLREITLEGANFIPLPMHYTMEYEKR